MKAVGAIQARGYAVMNQTGDNNKKELTCVQHLMTKHYEKYFLRVNSFYLYISLMPQIRKQNGKVRSPRSAQIQQSGCSPLLPAHSPDTCLSEFRTGP